MIDLTYKIVAFREVKSFNFNDCIDWALELSQQGISSPTLCKLASCKRSKNNPTHFSEYLAQLIDELNFPVLDRDMALLSYSLFYIKLISKGKDMKLNLGNLYRFSQEEKFDTNIYDFLLLYWAWNDIDFGKKSQFWESADKGNIESIVIIVANDWLKKYQAAIDSVIQIDN